MTRMYAEARDPKQMARLLQMYLVQKPADWKAWLDLCSIQLAMKQTNDAVTAMEQARRYGQGEAEAVIRKDARFSSIRGKPKPPRTMNLMGIPGVTTPR